MSTQFLFDDKDQELLNAIIQKRRAIDRPRMGDFVRFPTGEVERFSHDWGNGFQTAPIWAGSFFLCNSGDGDFSGSLHPIIDGNSLTRTEEKMRGKYWFFHHGQAGAGRAVHFDLNCRVYATTAEYKGYLTKRF